MMRNSRRTPLRWILKTSGIQSTRESSANFFGASCMMSPQASPIAAMMNPNATNDHGFMTPPRYLLPEVFPILGSFRALGCLRKDTFNDLLVLRQQSCFLHSCHHDHPIRMQHECLLK